MVQIQPFGDRVVVEVLTPEEVVGGLIVPTSKDKSNKGLVVAVGDGEDAKSIEQGDIARGHLERQAEFHASTQDEA